MKTQHLLNMNCVNKWKCTGSLKANIHASDFMRSLNISSGTFVVKASWKSPAQLQYSGMFASFTPLHLAHSYVYNKVITSRSSYTSSILTKYFTFLKRSQMQHQHCT